jgi:hypothetical protein
MVKYRQENGMKFMTIGMSKLVVGAADSPIRCDVVLHQNDGSFDDYCFIYHMSHILSDVMKYNEEIERIKRMMDSTAKFNVYQNPVEFLENCARCLENAPTNRYTKTAFSKTSVETMRYLTQLVADSDEEKLPEAHAMVARFMKNLQDVFYLQHIAIDNGFKIPEVTTYQRELLVGDRFRDFMAGVKGVAFKESQDKAREAVRKMTASCVILPEIDIKVVDGKENNFDIVFMNDEGHIELVHYIDNRNVLDRIKFTMDEFITHVLHITEPKIAYVTNRQTIMAIFNFFTTNRKSTEHYIQIDGYEKFIKWLNTVKVVGYDCESANSIDSIINIYTKKLDTAIIITKRGEALKSKYKYDYDYVEYAVEEDFDVARLTDVIVKEKARIIFIDSNLGSNIKKNLQELLTHLQSVEKATRGFAIPNINVETTAGFWLNVCGPMYLI